MAMGYVIIGPFPELLSGRLSPFVVSIEVSIVAPPAPKPCCHLAAALRKREFRRLGWLVPE